jgi:nucleoside phosphorylase
VTAWVSLQPLTYRPLAPLKVTMIRIRASRLRLVRGRSTRQDTNHRTYVTPPVFGILTALPEEFAAMRSFIDNPRRANVEGDRADYVIGTMPSADPRRTHEVTLTMLSETGNDAAASACTNLLRSYRSVHCLLMVGIAVGVPDPARPERHVRLGDIVVARRGIAEYDSVRDNDDGPVSRRAFPPPSPLLERRARLLQAGEMTGDRPWEDLLTEQTRLFSRFGRPPESTDIVYSSDGSGIQVQHPDMALSGHRPGQPKVHRQRPDRQRRPISSQRQETRRDRCPPRRARHRDGGQGHRKHGILRGRGVVHRPRHQRLRRPSRQPDMARLRLHGCSGLRSRAPRRNPGCRSGRQALARPGRTQ